VITGERAPVTFTRRGRHADLRWLRYAEHWGEWVRFYMKGRGQVGDEHASVAAAASWAWANGWLWADPPYGDIDIIVQLACRNWVLAGGAEPIEAAS
jgi:hypothetical protein